MTTGAALLAEREKVSSDTARVMYRLTDVDSMSSYDLVLVARALLAEGEGNGETIRRILREIVRAWDIEEGA